MHRHIFNREIIPGLCVLALFLSFPLCAQVDTGTILGTVKDTSGAVIPRAEVTLTNEGTNFTLSTRTGADGSFTFTPIRIGTYTVTAEAPGFQKAIQTHLALNIQQQLVVNFTLRPGAVTQTIEVTGAAPLLQTQNASVGQVIGSREINNLPLNGRNYTFLAQLAAGVTPDQQDTRGLGASGSFAANGLRPAQNNYLLDGIDDNADLVDFLNGTAYVVRPPVDAIAEFKVQTNDYSAEFGRSAGAVLNATLKSGTNQFHGNAWEFLRNDRFDAANFFENAGNQKKGEFRQNQFGATIGGPLRKDKTFFFGDYEGTRVRQATPWVSTVPTARERSSGYTDLSELIAGQSGTQTDVLGRSFPLGSVFDPATTRTIFCGVPDPTSGITPPCPSGTPSGSAIGFAREPFTGNQIPSSRIDPNAVKLLDLFPSPNGPGLFDNFTSDPILRNTINQFDVRVDQNFNERDQMFGSVSYSNEPEYLPGPFQGYADGGAFAQGYQTAVSINTALSETHLFSSTLVNEIRLGYSRIAASRLQPFADNLTNIPGQFGIQGIPQVSHNGGLPQITLEGMNTLGSNPFLPSVEYNSTEQLSENFTAVKAAHTLKAGFEGQHIRFSILQPPYGRGGWAFDGVYTEVPDTGGGNTGLAQMLLIPVSSTVPNGFDFVGGSDAVQASNISNTDMLRPYYALYFQDDWKTTPKLTLNLGLRWEYFGLITERYDAQSNFLPGAYSGQPDQPARFLIPKRRCNTPLSPDFYAAAKVENVDLVCSGNRALGTVPFTNFGPRVGFAYRLTSKLVARGGYGLFYGGFENSVIETYVDFPFQFTLFYPASDAAHPVTYPNGALGTLDNGLTPIPIEPSAVEPAGVSFTGQQYHMSTPYTQGYNFTLQYQVTPNQTFQVGYVGNTVRHLGVYLPTNAPTVILPPNLSPQDYVPYQSFARGGTFTSMAGNSYYNSLQVNFERRFSAGLNLLANFTWSKCRTDASDVLNATAIGYRAPLLNGFGIQGDYGFCDFDIPHVVHFSGTYQLPVGSGHRFLRNSHGVEDWILGGWMTNWILTLQDGQPWTVPCVIATTADFGCNALLVPGQNIYAGPHNVNQWINPAAFTSPPVAVTVGQTNYAPLGGAPSQFYGPGFHRLDFSLFKEFHVTERTRLEFRTEIFNLTNTPNFSPPGFSGNGVTAAPGALDYTDPATFGRITSTRDLQNDQREIQFALKFYW